MDKLNPKLDRFYTDIYIKKKKSKNQGEELQENLNTSLEIEFDDKGVNKK
jgi:hypothetical protein